MLGEAGPVAARAANGALCVHVLDGRGGEEGVLTPRPRRQGGGATKRRVRVAGRGAVRLAVGSCNHMKGGIYRTEMMARCRIALLHVSMCMFTFL